MNNSVDQPKGKRGKARASEGINVNMQYVVDKQGNPVDGHRATEIRRVARGIWEHLLTRSLAPERWSNASMRTMDIYKHEMQSRCEELRLCEDAWKAHQIAFDYYWSWRAGKEKRGAFNVKEEDEDIDPGDGKEVPNLTPSGKRPRPRPSAPASAKRMRSSSGSSIVSINAVDAIAKAPISSVQVRSLLQLRRALY